MRNGGERWLVLVVCVLPLSCEDAPPSPVTPPSEPTELAAQFDPATTGTLQGRVTWGGDAPQVPPFSTRPHPLAGLGLRERQVRENPNAPQIEAVGRGIAQAVVYLRGIDPARSRPWDLPPVRVEMRDRRLFVVQGEREARVGVVRRGAAVTMLSRDTFFHSLHGDGATFLSLAFPDAGQPLSRRLQQNGLVEWSSNCGYYWLRGYTFVTEHPYFAITDATGRFTLPQVPAGEYEVVCWLPNWNVARRDLDPDMAITSRVRFRPPVERVQRVSLSRQQTGAEDFHLSREMFGP
jgi:hypothetical protein